MARLELKEIITSPDSDTISGRATGEQYYKKCKVSEILDRNENIVIVIDDNNGISLLIASNYRTKKGQYLVVASNLFKAQKLYSSLIQRIHS